MIRLILSLMVLGASLFLYSETEATIIHIPNDQPTIQAGINAAQNGDTVLVTSGMYTGEGNRDIAFNGKSIYLTSDKGADSTVIDCEAGQLNQHFAFYLNGKEDSTAAIDGFTIKNAYFDGIGAVYLRQTAATLKNCIVRENNSGVIIGSGYYAEWPFIDGRVINCLITGNMGNGIQAYGNGTISKCEISSNGSNGVDLISPNNLELTGLLIRNNGGNGIEVRTGSAGNYSIFGNTVYGNNKGLYFYFDLPLGMGNNVTQDGTSIMANNIFAFNSDKGVQSAGASFDGVTISCNDSYGNPGGDWNPIYSNDPRAGDSFGNISVDPFLCNPTQLDFQIAVNSPCAASNNTCGILIGAFDVGCSAVVCGDIETDEAVNLMDVIYIISYLYKQGPAPRFKWSADVNSDSLINLMDIVRLINYLYKAGPGLTCI